MKMLVMKMPMMKNKTELPASARPLALVASLTLGLCLSTTASGCDGNTGPTFDQQGALTALADNVYLPTLAALTADTAALATETAALCDSLDESTLSSAREAWTKAKLTHKRVEAFAFGPIDDLRLGAAIDFWPLRTDVLEGYITDTASPDADAIAALGAAGRGLPVIEYLLFADADALTALDDGTTGATRCAYLEGAAADLANTARTLEQAWLPDGGDYRGTFVDGGGMFDNSQEALDVAVNEIIGTVELVAGTKLGTPLGHKTGGTPAPGEVESLYAHASLDAMKENVIAIEAVLQGSFDGVEDKSLLGGLTELNPSLKERIAGQIDNCKAALDAIPPPLTDAVSTSLELGESAFDALKVLQRLLAVDLAGAYGVTLTFNDNDGD